MDTIFALATAQGKAGVAVVRVSGPDAWSVGGALCVLPAARRAAVRVLRDGQGEVLDHALVLAFEAGSSFTGEPVVELQLHGSMAIVRAVMQRLTELGARLAEPGEFSRRALENGRMDLPQVESLADLIDAETEAQRRLAAAGLGGALGQKAGTWRADLLRAAALLEAVIDFADEEVPQDVSGEVGDLIGRVSAGLEAEIAGYGAAERVRSGFEVAIVGAPNVGKSTLLNALAGREAALTSEYAGTTRDVIEVRMDLGGLAVTLLDTAGVRDSEDPLEQMGIARGLKRARAADLRVFVTTAQDRPEFPAQPGDIVVMGKGDLTPGADYPVSGATGLGVDRLLADVTAVLSDRSQGAGLVSHERQKLALQRGLYDLEAALGLLKAGPDVYELAAEEIRSALRALEGLVGRVDVESILGEIFSRFCIGK